MKKWSGGMLILGLASILFLSHNFTGKQPRKQSAFDFFNKHPLDDSHSSGGGNEINSAHTNAKKLQVAEGSDKVDSSHAKAKKPHLINVEWLNDLYTFKNISVEVSRELLVWAQMRSLLSRSDALPETFQGIKEAAIAWKELLSMIEEEKASKFFESSNSSNMPEHKDCPYSVSAFNTTMTGSGNILQIPCGLVEDSSITVIGTPDGHHGRFHIELIGSKFPEEAVPPVVLQYNVCIPGENVMEEPIIVQNTWTSEVGWGKEERCPDYGSSKANKVDGLVKCNEQVLSSTVVDNLNPSHPAGHKLTNVSKINAHASTNFPFVEGNPFTATLWVGLEGFHMTVNGRHETSFAYRKKLEPWLVCGVKVAGGLDHISVLARGLPISEDLDLNDDVEYLKAPPVFKKRLVMVIGVSSAGNNFGRRMALRKSWMQYEVIRSGNVVVRFLVGLHKNKQVNFRLWKEAQAYGDIQLMPFVDYYSLLTLKTIAICILGTKILPAKYIMKTDDDAFVRVDEVLSSLKGKVSDGILYGLISFESSPERDKDNQWYISAEEWPHASYPPWAHGPGYVISRDIAKFIVQSLEERDLQLFKLEDVAVGIWIEQFKKQGHKVQYITSEQFYIGGCETNYIVAHYQNPRKVLCLWEQLQKEREPECCE